MQCCVDNDNATKRSAYENLQNQLNPVAVASNTHPAPPVYAE